MGIDIDPARVRRAGDDLLDEVADAKDRISILFDNTITAVERHPGWDTAGAVDGCRIAWHDRLNALVDRTNRIADGLVAASTNLSERDAESMERLGNVLDELAGP